MGFSAQINMVIESKKKEEKKRIKYIELNN